MTRPVAFFYECYTGRWRPIALLPTGYKGAEWSQEVLAIGTRRSGGFMLPGVLPGWWLLHRTGEPGGTARRHRRLGALVPAGDRTKFYYYALEFEPFLILSIVLCLD